MGVFDIFKRAEDRLDSRRAECVPQIVYREPPRPKSIGVMWSPHWHGKFDIISKHQRGMMWSLYVIPQRGSYNSDCFNQTKFWEITDFGEVYVASCETYVNGAGRVSHTLFVFKEHPEREYDEYGIPVVSDADNFMPKVNPFEQRKIAERNKRLIHKNFNLILDDDI